MVDELLHGALGAAFARDDRRPELMRKQERVGSATSPEGEELRQMAEVHDFAVTCTFCNGEYEIAEATLRTLLAEGCR